MRYPTLSILAAAFLLGTASIGYAAGASGQSASGSQTGTTAQSSGTSGTSGQTTGAAGTSGQTGAAGTTGGTSGQMTGQMSETEVMTMLEAQGYTNVSDLQQQGDMWTAQAEKGGQTVQLQIDPQSGEVMEQGS